MGAYFHAFHNTGAYYAFVGVVQVLAAVLLLSRRTALPGALLYLPVVANIFVLTTATHFGVATPATAGFMTLACLWLLVWDAHRLAGVLSPSFRPAPGRAVEPAVWDLPVPVAADAAGRWTLRASVVVGLAGAIGYVMAARGLWPFEVMRPAGIAVLVAGLLVPMGWIVSRPGKALAQPAI